MQNLPVLTASHLCKSYLQGDNTIEALKDVSLSINSGEFVMVTGESGSGKSTLLKLCGALDKPDGGKLTLFGEDTSGLSEKDLSTLRREKLGFIFQNFHLIPVLSVLENIEYAFKLRRIKYSLSSAIELLEQVGLEEKIHSLASTLSGGQMQRVAITRALVGSPELILADEPTANLDTQNKAIVMEAMTRLCRERNTTILLVTHDLSLSQWIERSIQLRDGYGDFQ